MAAVLEVTLAAVDAERLTRFWAAALGYEVGRVRPPYTVLLPPSGIDGPAVLIQAVPAHDGTGSRAHLDLRVDDPDAEVARLTGLGAEPVTAVDERENGGSRWWVMRDPEGAPFCVCPSRGAP